MTIRTGPWIPLVLALALTTVSLAPTVTGASHEAEPTPAESWQAIASSLDEGAVEDARATYEQRFADAASTAPRAKAAIESAWGRAQQADPGSAEYTVASQIVEKALLAVAYAQIHDAATTGDVDAASAYFEVLATKFDGEDELPEAKAAFGNLTADGLPTAVETLDAEYRALITSKVYHEAEETPDLLAGGNATIAAKEAAEARGYAFSLLDHLAEVLGNGTADELHAELGELVEFALAGETDGARKEAEEIHDLLATYGLATVPREKLTAFETYESHLEEHAFDEAEAVYEDAFAAEAAEYAPAADQRVHQAFEDAGNISEDAAPGELDVQIQILEKAILEISWKVGFHELAENEIDDGLAWLAPAAEKFGWLTDRPEKARPLGHIAASNEATSPHVSDATDNLAERFLDKVYEEIDEVFINWETPATAREKAIEGVLYYQPIRDEVARQLSQEQADALDRHLTTLFDATTAENRTQAEAAAGKARGLLDAFSNAGEEVSELDAVLRDLERTLSIINAEIDEHFEYKERGNAAKAQEEIEESKAFIAKARATFDDHRDELEAIDAEAASSVDENIATISSLLEQDSRIGEIPPIVDETVELLDAFRASQPAGPAVDVRIGPAEPLDGHIEIPVALVGVPSDGFSAQATLTYDADAFSVDDVEIPVQVGASDTSTPGEIRFNAAGTDVGEGPVTVARVTITPGSGVTQANLDLSVETLTDAQGEPLRLGNVTGNDVDLSSTDGPTGDATQQPAPAPGPMAALAGLASAAFVAARRRR